MKRTLRIFTPLFFLFCLSFSTFSQKTSSFDDLTRDECEWALRAVMAYKTFHEAGYYPTYDELTMKISNKDSLITMYKAECLGNLQTRNVIDKGDEIVMFIKLCLMKTGGYCDAFEMSKIVKNLSEAKN